MSNGIVSTADNTPLRGNFANTGRLVLHVLRRERVMSTIWIVILVLFSVALAPAMDDMFTDGARQALAETLMNPAMIAMMGPVYGVENYTSGVMYAGMMVLWMAITVGVMNIFLVVRHTRADEEKGRAEVVRSLPTGRLAMLSAALISALIINTLFALLTGLGLAMMGIESMDFAGSMLCGISLGAVGLVFAGIAAIFSQLSASSRGAIGYSIAALGAFYMLRAAGDMNSEALSLISPLGLILRSQFYLENNLWPTIVLLLEAIALTAAAFALNSVRDIDQGFIQARPGRSEASAGLKSPFGLSFRLLKNTIIVWIAVIFMFGASYGSIMGDIEAFVAESEFYQMIIGVNDEYTVPMMFTTMINIMMSLICLIPLLSMMLKLRGEEKEGRTEHVLARAVSRHTYMSGYAMLAFVTSVVLQFATAAGLYLATSAVLEEAIAFSFLVKASLVYLPALWVMTGAAAAVSGLVPKASGAIWAYYGFTFFTAFMGRMLELPEWLPKLSPFAFIPQLPTESIEPAPLIILTIIAVVLTAVGYISYRRRDITA